MYYALKIAPDISNAARELAGHLSNPGTEHCRDLEQCVGYLTSQGTQAFNKPRYPSTMPKKAKGTDINFRL
jgi:hypothetical protein